MNQFVYKSIPLLLLASLLPLQSQTYAVQLAPLHAMVSAQVAPGARQIQLREALHMVGKRFNVIFEYNDQVVANKAIDASLLMGEMSLDALLPRLLEPFSLRYQRFDQRSYLILSKKAARQKKSAMMDSYPDEIPSLPSSTVNSETAAQLNTSIIVQPSENRSVVTVEQRITGRVTDAEKGEPLPGVSVVIKGTTRGTTTNRDGQYSITIPDENGKGKAASLVYSFVGYTSEEVTVGARTVINVSLKPDDKTLDEVVVVGYGELRKSDVTGAVSKLKVEGNEDKPIVSVDQLIQGRVSGVQINQNSGAPGSGLTFLIRGSATVTGSNQPLIILDGFPVEAGQNALGASQGSDGWSTSQQPTNPLAAINPNDIESIEILKDASSTAIYGSRGANGVVIITTKKGKLKRDQVNYNFRMDISQIPRKIDVLNTAEFIEYANEARRNSGLDSAFTAATIPTTLQTNVNWQDLVYQQSISTDHQLSLTGGDDKTKYLLSANYVNQVGVVKNSEYTRGSFRANIDRQVSRQFRLSTNFNASLNVNRYAQQNYGSGNASGSVVTGALTFRPFSQPYADADQNEPNLALQSNPLTLVTRGQNITRANVFLLNLKGDYKLLPFLTYSINGGVNATLSERDAYLPRGTYQGDLQNGVAYHGENKNYSYLLENTLSLNKSFGKKHRLNAVVGYAWQEWTAKAFGVQASNFSTDALTYNNFSLANNAQLPSNFYQQWALSSFISRANYVYDNRYLLTLTGRADGASRLAPGNKWAFFPSVAVGWNVHNEPFLAGQKIFDELKFRVSYGVSGNQNVGVGADRNRVGVGRAVIGTNIVTGLFVNTIGNPSLGWETTTQWNAGLDAAFLKNRLRVGLEVYDKMTEDLLINLSLPTSTGFRDYATNFGKVSNRGIEFELNAGIIEKKFRWNVAGNISRNVNKVKQLGPDGLQLFGPTYFGGVNALSGQVMSTAQVGYPIGSFYSYVTDGVYQNQEEINKGPKPIGTPKPGDIRFKDINGDGQITTADRTIIGNPYPAFTFGITNDFSYQGFTLSVFVMGNIGQDIANLNRFQLDNMNYLGLSNIRREAWENRWRGEGTSNYYPAPRASQTASYQNFSDFLIEDGSFVRLKNVTLSYSLNVLPVKWLRNAKVFVTGTNLLTWTKYKGYDPEVSANATSALTPGIDNGTIPLFRTYSTGLSLGF